VGSETGKQARQICGMNVTFHILSAVGASAVLSSAAKDPGPGQSTPSRHWPLLAVAFVTGVLLHGLLDWIPHSYPINPVADVSASLILLTVVTILVQPKHRFLFGACALGALAPDLVDLGPVLINKRLGWSLPVFKFFPWHWRQYSGSIYDGSHRIESLLLHLAVVGISLILTYLYRDRFFRQIRRE
jgi:hypothetical protein